MADIFVPTGGPPASPGEILLEEFLKPMGITAKEFAAHVFMTPAAISEIIHGRRGITPVTALKFSHAFGTTEQFWLNLSFQMTYTNSVIRKKPRN